MSGSVACAARQKADLRRELRQRCRELPEEYCRSADAAIARFLCKAPAFAGARQIFCFVGKAGEIDTLPLLRRILEQGSNLCVPLCLEPGRMEARLLQNLEDLIPGRYGILEPRLERCPPVEASSLDLALVPCLSATRQGLRLGQGGGYYDRYLAGGHVPSILLCREKMLSPELPKEDWDLSFDWLLTEQGFWHQGRKEETCCVLR